MKIYEQYHQIMIIWKNFFLEFMTIYHKTTLREILVCYKSAD